VLLSTHFGHKFILAIYVKKRRPTMVLAAYFKDYRISLRKNTARLE